MNDDFLQRRPAPGPGPMYGEGSAPYSPYAPAPLPLKSKFLATVLSMFIPGTGQMYVGSTVRGMSIMLLLVLDIVAIVFFVSGPVQFNVLPVTLLSLLIPVLYFYNVFDAMHQADHVNRAIRQGIPFSEHGAPYGTEANSVNLLLGFIGAVVFFCSLSAFGGWWDGLLTVNTAIGGAALLAVGAYLFMREQRGKKSKL